MPRGLTADHRDAVQAMTAGEEHQGPRRHRNRRRPVSPVPGDGRSHVHVALVVRGAEHRNALEVAAGLTRLQCDGHHEIRLIEMPRQLVSGAHHRDVYCAEVVVVAI